MQLLVVNNSSTDESSVVVLLCCNELEVSKLCKLIFFGVSEGVWWARFFFTFGAQCGLRGLMLPWFDLLYRCYIYCFLVYIVSFPTYPFFLHLCYLSPLLLIFSLRIDPLCFQVGFHKRHLNLTLVFCVYFLLWYISSDWWMHACLQCFDAVGWAAGRASGL